MKNLVGKKITTEIIEEGLRFSIEVPIDRRTIYTVNIEQQDTSEFYLTIDENEGIIVETTEFTSLFDALKNADEIIDELLETVNAKQ